MSNNTLRVITQTESWAQEVRQDVVETLELLLAQAKSGKLLGVAYSGVTADGMVVTGYTKTTGLNATIGGLERVKHHMLQAEMYQE